MPEFFQALGGSVEVTGHPVNQLVAQDDTVVALGDQFNDPGLAAAFA